MTDAVGLFDETLQYAGDWDMWLRCVQSGYQFKKVEEILGLYLYNTEGLSTRLASVDPRFKEERRVFFKYKSLFEGHKNYDLIAEYFQNER